MDHASQNTGILPDMATATEAPTNMTNFKSVTDYGVTINLKLPKIPCSKYTIIGNPKMRVKRDCRRDDSRKHVWKVPKLVQSSLAARVRSDSPSKCRFNGAGNTPVDVTIARRRFRQQERVNSLDRSSLYAAKSEDSFKGINETFPPRKVTLVDDRFKTEKRFINKFYRQRSSALLSPIQNKRPSRTVSISLPSVVDEYVITGATKNSHVGRVNETQQSVIQLDRYHTKACLYCDVAGQKYCSECRRKHRHIKMKESALTDSNTTPVRLPTLPSCRVQMKDHDDAHRCTLIEEHTSTLRQQHSSRKYRNKDWNSSTLFDEPPSFLKGIGRDKAKTRAKYWILPRVDLPVTGDITNDNDNRHL